MMLSSRDLEWNLLTEKVISLSVNWAHATHSQDSDPCQVGQSFNPSSLPSFLSHSFLLVLFFQHLFIEHLLCARH